MPDLLRIHRWHVRKVCSDDASHFRRRPRRLWLWPLFAPEMWLGLTIEGLRHSTQRQAPRSVAPQGPTDNVPGPLVPARTFAPLRWAPRFALQPAHASQHTPARHSSQYPLASTLQPAHSSKRTPASTHQQAHSSKRTPAGTHQQAHSSKHTPASTLQQAHSSKHTRTLAPSRWAPHARAPPMVAAASCAPSAFCHLLLLSCFAFRLSRRLLLYALYHRSYPC